MIVKKQLVVVLHTVQQILSNWAAGLFSTVDQSCIANGTEACPTYSSSSAQSAGFEFTTVSLRGYGNRMSWTSACGMHL